MALLAACQGKDDLSASGCLPLRAPADCSKQPTNHADRKGAFHEAVPLSLRNHRMLFAACAPAVVQTTVLYSARPAIGLSMSDQMAARQALAEFTVTMPDGKATTATAKPENDGERAGTVHYPSDFGNAVTRVGNYTWQARMGGKVVQTGRFAYRPSKEGQLLFVPG